MKNHSAIILARCNQNRLPVGALAVLSLLLLAGQALRLGAADINWTEWATTNSLPTQWLQTNNWDALRVPTNTDNAVVGGAGTNLNITVQMANAKGFASVGSITLSAGDTTLTPLTIYNNVTTTNGVLEVLGLNGILLSNASSSATLQFDNTTATDRLGLGLGSSGQIYVSGAGIASSPNAQITCYSVISEYGGSQGFTKTGGGVLLLRTNNTYTGSTTNAAGTIAFDASGTFGSGVGMVYLTGGSIECYLDRSGGAPLANPVVMSASGYVYSSTGTAGTTRTLPFSGAWSGTPGTALTLANLTSAANNTFQFRLIGGFTFAPDIAFFVETATSSTLLQLYNSSTNGTQTFTGTISDSGGTQNPGSVWRSGAGTSPGGTSIFTGNNTYSGGTRISYGTLLANNTVGSALGSGAVIVTNAGILGGTGYVVAPTSVSLGGTVWPGATISSAVNFNISDLTLATNSTYVWQIEAAAPNPGVNQDQITCSTQWTDAGSSANPITIKVNSLGVSPTGWNSANNYDWVIINSTTANNFNASDFTVDTSLFSGAIAGGWNLYLSGGALHLTYSSGYPLVINVPSGSESQGQAGYPTIIGPTNVIKIGNGEAVMTNSLNAYSGLTEVLAGTVSLAVSALSGSGSLGANSSSTLLGNTLGTSNATLNINTDGVLDAHPVVVQAGSSGTKTIGTTLASGTATFTGDVTLNDNATLNAAPGGTAVFSGDFGGAGGLTLGGGGTITMSGSGSYSGPTTVNSLTLDLNGKALGTNTLTLSSSPLTLDNTSGSSVTLNNCPQNWNADFSFVGTTSLNLGAGPVSLGGYRTITVNSNTLTVGGVISGNFGLTKLGAGTLALTAATNCAYTGPTTNQAGVLAVNATATFGNGAGLLVLSGGNILNTGSRSGSPITNQVLITTNTYIYGDSTDTSSPDRYFPMTGPFTVAAGSLMVGNIGTTSTVFTVILQGTNFSNINWPIVVGDTNFDTPGAFSQLDLANDNTSATQFINTVISGAGIVRRSWGTFNTLNTGGTTVFNTLSTFSGGGQLISGSLGFGTNSVSSGGVVTAGPVGTGQFTIGDANNEAALGLFAYGGPCVIDNMIYLNGGTNIVVMGANNLTFTGPVNAGGVAKTWNVQGTGVMTLSGQITNSTAGSAPLVKNGPGTLVLSGNNLYAGATTVLEGELLVNNTSGSGTGTNNVSVLNGATLGGSGTIAGPVVVTNGNIAPGNNSAGTLTLGGGLDLSSGGTYVWELAANSTTGPGINFDVLAVTNGSVVLGGSAQLSLQFVSSATPPDTGNAFWQSAHTWTVLTVSGSAANPGSTVFSNPVNTTYAAGSFTNYADASGNIVLAFTPAIAAAPRPVISGNIVGAGTANAALSWTAVSGTNYQVQYKTNLNQTNWLVLGSVTATSGTASFTDTTGPNRQRFYRVIVP